MGSEGMNPVALGFRAMRGGAVMVGVRLEEHVPCLVMSSFFPTADEDDRLAFEPYHVAAEDYRSCGESGLDRVAALYLARSEAFARTGVPDGFEGDVESLTP